MYDSIADVWAKFFCNSFAAAALAIGTMMVEIVPVASGKMMP